MKLLVWIIVVFGAAFLIHAMHNHGTGQHEIQVGHGTEREWYHTDNYRESPSGVHFICNGDSMHIYGSYSISSGK